MRASQLLNPSLPLQEVAPIVVDMFQGAVVVARLVRDMAVLRRVVLVGDPNYAKCTSPAV